MGKKGPRLTTPSDLSILSVSQRLALVIGQTTQYVVRRTCFISPAKGNKRRVKRPVNAQTKFTKSDAVFQDKSK